VRNRIAGERQQNLECPRPCREGNDSGGAAARRIVFDKRLDVIDQQRHIHASTCCGDFAQQLIESSGHLSSKERSSTSPRNACGAWTVGQMDRGVC